MVRGRDIRLPRRSADTVILRSAWVVPVSAAPIRDGYVEVDGDCIVNVGSCRADDFAGRTVIDLGHVVLTPGLVNPHTHLELGCYAGRLAPGPFWGWLTRLVELRSAPGQVEREAGAVAEGAWRCLRAGVTCVGDISRRNLAWPKLKQVPIRKVCFVELLTLADHPPRNPEELRAGVDAVEEDRLLTAGVSPHTPFTVPPDQIRAALVLADELDRPWCLHWAETREEVAFLAGKPGALPAFLEELLRQCNVESPNCTPGELLWRCGSGLRPGALAHGNYAEDADIAHLADKGHSVVYCPRAHRFFGHTPHPLPRMRAAGVRVALGTDSVASNEGLSMLDEARQVYEQVPDAPSPADLLRMVTLDAANALGLDSHIGSLDVGKQADLAAFPCSAEEADPITALIANAPAPSAVWVAGEQVI